MAALICFGIKLPVANKIISRTTRCRKFINRNFDLTTYSLTFTSYHTSLIVLPLFTWRGSVLLHYVCFFRLLALFEQHHKTSCEVANHFTLLIRKFTLHANSLLFENVGFVANRLHLNSYQASVAAAVIYHTYFQICDDDPDTTLHIKWQKNEGCKSLVTTKCTNKTFLTFTQSFVRFPNNQLGLSLRLCACVLILNVCSLFRIDL